MVVVAGAKFPLATTNVFHKKHVKVYGGIIQPQKWDTKEPRVQRYKMTKK